MTIRKSCLNRLHFFDEFKYSKSVFVFATIFLITTMSHYIRIFSVYWIISMIDNIEQKQDLIIKSAWMRY